jgi:hypothetical protein
MTLFRKTSRPSGRCRYGLTASAILLLAVLAGSCNLERPAPGGGTWIDETGDAPGVVIARQFGGMSAAMVEIDHRYAELYFAGQDGNWAYADHQVEHMVEAMDLALERRPGRAESARAYFYPPLERLDEAIEAEDGAEFEVAFQALRQACNACHVAEGEAGMHVRVPTQRRTSIGPEV